MPLLQSDLWISVVAESIVTAILLLAKQIGEVAFTNNHSTPCENKKIIILPLPNCKVTPFTWTLFLHQPSYKSAWNFKEKSIKRIMGMFHLIKRCHGSHICKFSFLSRLQTTDTNCNRTGVLFPIHHTCSILSSGINSPWIWYEPYGTYNFTAFQNVRLSMRSFMT